MRRRHDFVTVINLSKMMPFSREITGVIIKKIPPTSLSVPPMNLDFESVSLVS